MLLQLITGGLAPSAILLRHADEILALGILVAEEMFGQTLPMVVLGDEAFAAAATARFAAVDGAHAQP